MMESTINIVFRGNIVAVKFNDIFVIKNKLKNYKNTLTKKIYLWIKIWILIMPKM